MYREVSALRGSGVEHSPASADVRSDLINGERAQNLAPRDFIARSDRRYARAGSLGQCPFFIRRQLFARAKRAVAESIPATSATHLERARSEEDFRDLRPIE